MEPARERREWPNPAEIVSVWMWDIEHSHYAHVGDFRRFYAESLVNSYSIKWTGPREIRTWRKSDDATDRSTPEAAAIAPDQSTST